MQEPGQADGDHRAEQWAADVDPDGADVAGDDRGGQRAGRVHRRALERERDQPAQRDRAPDGQRGLVPHDPIAIGRAEDHRHEQERQHDLQSDCRRGGDVGPADAGTETRAEQGGDRERRGQGADQLGAPVRQQPGHREQPSQREGQADDRVEMGPRAVADGVDQGGHHKGRRDRPRCDADLSAAGRCHGVGADGHEHEGEGPERLGDEPTRPRRRVGRRLP